MNSPTTAFRHVLSQYGLYPDEILWDDRPHRFPGRDKNNPKNTSAWYVAFVDRARCLVRRLLAGTREGKLGRERRPRTHEARAGRMEAAAQGARQTTGQGEGARNS